MNSLVQRTEEYRADYESVTGKRFDHFFCPILHRDEQVEMCRGHVVADAFEICDEWVPQRKDLDNFYGSAVEADLIKVVEDRGKNPFRIWLDPELRKRHRPKLEYDGKEWGHYFPKGDVPQVEGHTPIVVDGPDGIRHKMMVKVTPDVLLNAENAKINLVIERDYRPEVTAAMIKAAHLTMFHIFRYDHVFRSSGLFLASILRDFYEANKPPKRIANSDVEDYFLRYSRMISPLVVADKHFLQGTITDRRFIACVSSTKARFALGVVVRAKDDMFCVFLPTDQGINTYFSFLNEPPPSIAAQIVQFDDGGEQGEARWMVSPGEPIRLPLDQPMPDYFSRD
jgi:hypothetical protein